MLENQREDYAKSIKFIHWLVAILVIAMLSAGFFLEDLPEKYISTAFFFHKSIGLTILLLMVIRIILVGIKGRAPLPDTVSLWEKIFARIVQNSFYILLIAMPLTGWILSVAANRIPSYFGLFPVPFPGVEPNKQLSETMGDAHEIIAWILIVFVVFHVAGALKHHFFDKDNVLLQMWPRRKKG